MKVVTDIDQESISSCIKCPIEISENRPLTCLRSPPVTEKMFCTGDLTSQESVFWQIFLCLARDDAFKELGIWCGFGPCAHESLEMLNVDSVLDIASVPFVLLLLLNQFPEGAFAFDSKTVATSATMRTFGAPK